MLSKNCKYKATSALYHFQKLVLDIIILFVSSLLWIESPVGVLSSQSVNIN